MPEIDTPPAKSRRNKEQTKQKLIDAVGRLLCDKGCQSVGINSVAREAGVDKALIYRYFKDLNGLLRAYTQQKDFWIKKGDEVDISTLPTTELEQTAKNFYQEFFTDFWDNCEVLELLKWELMGKNGASDIIAEERGLNAERWIERIQKVWHPAGIDTAAMLSLINGGLYFLAMHAKMHQKYDTIDLGTDQGRERIQDTVEQLLTMIFHCADHLPPKEVNDN
ncbi:MAG: TetR/AcrR family transcriptional regulator [Bacteroidota bacterium]